MAEQRTLTVLSTSSHQRSDKTTIKDGSTPSFFMFTIVINKKAPIRGFLLFQVFVVPFNCFFQSLVDIELRIVAQNPFDLVN